MAPSANLTGTLSRSSIGVGTAFGAEPRAGYRRWGSCGFCITAANRARANSPTTSSTARRVMLLGGTSLRCENFSIEKISGPRVSEQTLVFERATRTLIDQLSQSFVNRGDLPSTRHLHRIYRHRAPSHIPRALRHVDGDAVGSLLLNAIAVVASKAH